MTSDFQTLSHEIQTLRRELSRQRALSTVLLLAGLLIGSASRVFSQAPPSRDLTLHSLKIVGLDGKTRVLLSGDEAVNKNGGAIALFDNNEAPRIGLMAAPGGGNVSVLRADGEPMAVIGADNEGGLVALTAVAGKGKVNIAAVRLGVGLNLVSSDGTSQVNLAADAQGSGLQVRAKGKNILLAGGDKLGGVLEIYDPTGKLKKRLP